MSYEGKKKLFKLLFQLDDYYQKIRETIKQINVITQDINLSPPNFTIYMEQLNSLIKTMKSNLRNYYNQFRVNKINTPIETDLKIYIGFKQPSGTVHTFETQYGTTIDKLISTYNKEIMQGQNINEYAFVYGDKILNLGDMNLIENVFNDKQDPTIFVKKREEVIGINNIDINNNININNINDNIIVNNNDNNINNDQTDFNFILE